MKIVRVYFPLPGCGGVGFAWRTILDFSFYLSPCGDFTFDREPCGFISVFKSFAVFPSLGGV